MSLEPVSRRRICMDLKDAGNAVRELSLTLGAQKVLTDDFILSSYTRDATMFYLFTPKTICRRSP
jgi:hypothetical protein